MQFQHINKNVNLEISQYSIFLKLYTLFLLITIMLSLPQ